MSRKRSRISLGSFPAASASASSAPGGRRPRAGGWQHGSARGSSGRGGLCKWEQHSGRPRRGLGRQAWWRRVAGVQARRKAAHPPAATRLPCRPARRRPRPRRRRRSRCRRRRRRRRCRRWGRCCRGAPRPRPAPRLRRHPARSWRPATPSDGRVAGWAGGERRPGRNDRSDAHCAAGSARKAATLLPSRRTGDALVRALREAWLRCN